jgi:SulP family sulfate permease
MPIVVSEETRMLATSAPSPLRWLIIDAGAITNVDFTAARVVRELHEDLSVQGTGLGLLMSCRTSSLI